MGLWSPTSHHIFQHEKMSVEKVSDSLVAKYLEEWKSAVKGKTICSENSVFMILSASQSAP